MVKKTISELNDILDTQRQDALVAVEQNGATFKARVRPNPPRQLNVTSLAQLETQFGTNIEIPNNEDWTTVVDASFNLTKPFKIGLNSSLEVRVSTSQVALTYTGPGAMFQNTNPANPITSLLLPNVILLGNGTNTLFNIVATSFVNCNQSVIAGFADLGFVETPVLNLRVIGLFEIQRGLVIKNSAAIVTDGISLNNSADTGVTFISIIGGASPASVSIDKTVLIIPRPGDTLLYLDPTSIAGTRFSVQNSTALSGNLFQQGTDITISSIADNGSGRARFTSSTPHGLIVGKVIELSSFADSSYNGVFRVTVIPTTTTFDVEEITFNADDSGNMNAKSFDSTDVQVVSDNNFDHQDSMFTGAAGLEVFGSEISSSSLAQDNFEVITSTSWLFSNLERFVVGVNNEGQLITQDTTTRRYAVEYSATIEKTSGGPNTDIGIVILKNGSISGFNPPHTANTGKIQILGSDIIELTKDDTIQIAVINYDSSSAVIDISQISLVVNLA